MDLKYFVVTATDPGDHAWCGCGGGDPMHEAPVFQVGEILILQQPYGRELGYPGRKPSKWGVQGMTFDNVEEAISKYKEVCP